jgi:hypothetical protein
MPEPTTEQIDAFIQRWEKSGAAERANYVLFLTELCDLLDIPRPDPAGPDNATNLYCFERAVVRRNPDGTTSDTVWTHTGSGSRIFTPTSRSPAGITCWRSSGPAKP